MHGDEIELGTIILASSKDPASLNIARRILELNPMNQVEGGLGVGSWRTYLGNVDLQLILVDQSLAHCQDLESLKDADLVIFVSRHQSESGIPTLSAHVPGNIDQNLYGGLPRKVSVAPPNSLRRGLLELARQRDRLGLQFEVSFECTHHGPSLDVPAMFLEIGSTPKEWGNRVAGEAVALAALEAARVGETCPVALGIGGPHYNRKFTEICLTRHISFGHIISKHNLTTIDEEMISQCIERSADKVDMVILDWKGMKGDERKAIVRILEKKGLDIKKTNFFD
ncbi:MAG TPA: D-aminoacyl-tRNA deacylase [Candidatus Bathyarchaeia archaeon]|nr:D-aminoacyl-tRNA deacylase [Candidatus Bathyarchaeia archaeon]